MLSSFDTGQFKVPLCAIWLRLNKKQRNGEGGWSGPPVQPM